MEKKNMKRVRLGVLETINIVPNMMESIDYDDQYTLEQFLKNLKSYILSELNEENLPTNQIKMKYSTWGDEFEVFYEREETDEEFQKRKKANEKRKETARKKKLEREKAIVQREKELLEQLKKKYEGN